jgi:DNA-binding transcriptional regulator GbsR (MarR family)
MNGRSAQRGRHVGVGVARSNVSTSLKELQGWGTSDCPRFGDKRDHFESMKDVWDMFRSRPDGPSSPRM